jgi:prevent-host-death family protein
VTERRVGVSEYLRQVKAGGTVIITEHGKPVGRLIPADRPLEDRLEAMVQARMAEWNGKRLPPAKPPARTKKGHSVAAMLIEDRR